MSHFEFVIPVQRKDLQELEVAGQYVVRHVYQPSDLRASGHELLVALSTDRGEYVLDKFDLVYSALVHFSSLEAADREQIWEIVNKGYGYLISDLTELLDQPSLDCELRTKYLNLLKMSTYLLCQLTADFEDVAQRPTLTTTTGKGRGRRAAEESDRGDWETQRLRVLRQLFQVVRLQLRRLWDPPVPEEDFVNMIGNVCYQFLVLPTVGHVRNKPLRDAIFQVLGELVRCYGHALSCSIKILQLLQQHEHAAAPLAEGVVTIALECGARSLINGLVREIVGTEPEELARDTAATRRYAEFLSLMAGRAPDLVLSNMCLLIGHLNGDSYQMRNAVLAILGDMLSVVLHGEQLDSRQRALRDQFMECLHDHMHDFNAFVRTKSLQIWRRLVQDGCVPLSRLLSVLQRVVGRLQDKASGVRRAAVQLLVALLQANAHAVQLSVDQLEEQLVAEQAKLAELGVGVETPAGGGDERPLPDEPLLRAVSVVRQQLLSALTAAVDDAAAADDEQLLKRRRRLLQQLKADGRKDEAAVELLLREPTLVPGLMPQLENAGTTADNEEDDDKDDSGVADDSESTEQEGSGGSGGAAPVSRDVLTLLLAALAETGSTNAVDPAVQAEIDKQRLVVIYFKDSVAFARLADESIPAVIELLYSTQATDVLEAISFFVTALKLGLLRARDGIRKMLALVWSKETSVKEAVVDAYKRLFILSDENDRLPVSDVVRNLMSLCDDASPAQLQQLEELVAQLVGSAHLSDDCVQLLWRTFTGAADDRRSDARRRAAVQLISMVAGTEPSVVSSNLDVLVEHGLGARHGGPLPDFRTVRYVCAAALKMAPRKVSAESDEPPLRLAPEHELFVRLADILVKGIKHSEDTFYTPMAQVAVDTIFLLSDTPDVVMEELLRRLAAELAPRAGSAPVARWLSILGHTAVRHMIHLDVYMFTELKRRNRLRELAAGRQPSAVQRLSQSLPSSASNTPQRRQSQSGADSEDTESVIGAVADDADAKFIQDLCEHHLVCGQGLLAKYLPMIVDINTQPDRYRDSRLRRAAALALAKYMTVSSVVCEQHLQLLFTVLERSEDEVVRSNTVLVLRDMSQRFPNLIEPWTPRIYARLRDDSVVVRKTTLSVLSHLILNEMVKARGQISDIAQRLVDDDDSISELARAFFSELAQEGNSLYNMVPNMISQLSDATVGLEEDQFRIVMQYVLSLIEKDRHLEPLVEKLCLRLQAATLPRQWRDIAFCLCQLNFSERCVKKLLQYFSCCSNRLQDEQVYDFFSKIVAAAKKDAKSMEARVVSDELEERLQEAHQRAMEDASAAAGAQCATKRRTQPADARSTRKRQPPNVNDDTVMAADLTPRRSAMSAARRGPRTRLPSSSDSEHDSEPRQPAPADEPDATSDDGDSDGDGDEQQDKENTPPSPPTAAEKRPPRRRQRAADVASASPASPLHEVPVRRSRRRR